MTTETGISRFYKISEELYIKDLEKNFPIFKTEEVRKFYNEILLPKRATIGSAGYDFFAPFDFSLNPSETITIPTGIRCEMKEGFVLMLFPRSSLGFKYRLQLDNTVGIIDSDYFYSDNEGHIFVKITNDNNNKSLSIKKSTAFCQGIFIKYYLTVDDETNNTRNGGLGSTNEKN